MQHWPRPATDDTEFWISCKRPTFLSSLSCLQVIQNKRPWCWAAAYVHMWQLDWILINYSSPAFNATSLWCLIFSLQTLACELEEKSAQLEMLKLLQGCEKQDQKVNNFCEWQIRSCKTKPSLKIGSVNKAFLFWYWQRLKNFFLGIKLFCFSR